MGIDNATLFERELEELINRNNVENESNTPEILSTGRCQHGHIGDYYIGKTSGYHICRSCVRERSAAVRAAKKRTNKESKC